jgi:hypothetical protein
LGESLAPESLADFGQGGSFRIGQAQSGRQVRAQNPIFCCQQVLQLRRMNYLTIRDHLRI